MFITLEHTLPALGLVARDLAILSEHGYGSEVGAEISITRNKIKK